MADAQEIEVHYKGLIGQLRDSLDTAAQATAVLTASAIHGDPVDVVAMKNVHTTLTDALNLAKNVTGEPQGNPVPDTGPQADLTKLPDPPATGALAQGNEPEVKS